MRRIAIRVLIAAVALTLAAVALIARQQHLEKLERTRAVAADVLRGTEEVFEDIEPLSANVQASLRTFRNDDHVAAARQFGISRVSSRTEAAELAGRQRLVHIVTNPVYHVRPLEYSIPYVTPSAANLLDRIGHRFHEALAAAGLPPFRFVVTSVTRTRTDQEALRSVNVNAAQESSHEFGTTFDLHYEDFDYEGRPTLPDSSDLYEKELREMIADGYNELSDRHSEALKAILGDVLLALQSEEDALVIYERRQPVFHVTAARPIPDAPPRLRDRSTQPTPPFNVAP